jgi:hypothetical protein
VEALHRSSHSHIQPSSDINQRFRCSARIDHSIYPIRTRVLLSLLCGKNAQRLPSHPVAAGAAGKVREVHSPAVTGDGALAQLRHRVQRCPVVDVGVEGLAVPRTVDKAISLDEVHAIVAGTLSSLLRGAPKRVMLLPCGGDKVDSATSGTCEVFITIRGERHYLWRAVDQDGDVLDILITRHRDRRAAKRFFRKVLKHKGGPPWQLLTDEVRSYPAAHREVFPCVTHGPCFPRRAVAPDA